MTLADRLVVMNAGHIDQVGTPAEVYGWPATRFVARFIGSPSMNIIPATLAGPFAVFGKDRKLALAASAAGAGAVELGFRPEHAVITRHLEPGSIPFEVELVEDIGTARLCHGAVDGLEVAVSVPPSQTVKGGDLVGLTVEPEHIHLFDVKTGKRMDGRFASSPPATPNLHSMETAA